ncbi:methionine aminopeptidase 1b, putative [Plasmodium chabaudi chabaudi]|uniref:Methionine aminopeptidase n=1 Tax=Plasmodium chabaudi chabaudi TaxID=31271 RepID=A0A4V6M9I7_PLACU|nr:methionine aminopeptidase 1b, putative [Plasmodium chabaudi chabaudi]VTZ69615.1 methionine aminopeptidase 1b, putative [Plasmodium chabaudi chabaudi]|eukprot:XP_745685.2 methionine aminopeptidase 1b, putative [Plasmodium chabaudi chabaudi]
MSDNTKQCDSNSNKDCNNVSKSSDAKKKEELESKKCNNTHENSTSFKREDESAGIEKARENNLVCKGCGENLTKKLSCPVCLKNKINSYFCSQECFKRSWKEHSKMHPSEKENNEKEADKESKKVEKNNYTEVTKELLPQNYDPTNRKYWIYDSHLRNFLSFNFSGNIRPWPISKMNYVPDHIDKPDYAITSIPTSELKYKKKSDIYVNNSDEIERIKEACILGRKTLDYAHSLVSPGVTTDEIDKKVHDFIIKNNAYPSPLNYYEFPKSCCTSVNEIVCHGIPDYRPLKNGDIINIDISVYYKGVHADLNETYFVGENISNEAKQLVETCYFSLMEAIKKCKPGMLYKNLGNIIDAYVSKKHFSVVRTYSGHGVGKLFHSNPTIPHFRKNKAVGIMKPGHVFTIEPMINEGHYADVLWPDKWTSATADGKLSAQFEHTLLVTQTGVEILTKRLPDSPSLGFDTKDDLYII